MFEVSGSYLNLVFQPNPSDTTLMGEGDCSLITCQMKVESIPQSAALTLWEEWLLMPALG